MSDRDPQDDGSLPLLEVGRVLRAHGVAGDVIVELYTDRPERLAAGAEFHTDRGVLTVTASRRHQGRWIVSTAEIDSREAEREYQQLALTAPALPDPDELWVHELIGCRVLDTTGETRGVVDAVQQNPASDLLVLDTGALVPLTFVVDGPTDGRLTVDVPPGLFELYESSGE